MATFCFRATLEFLPEKKGWLLYLCLLFRLIQYNRSIFRFQSIWSRLLKVDALYQAEFATLSQSMVFAKIQRNFRFDTKIDTHFSLNNILKFFFIRIMDRPPFEWDHQCIWHSRGKYNSVQDLYFENKYRSLFTIVATKQLTIMVVSIPNVPMYEYDMWNILKSCSTAWNPASGCS